MEAMLTLLLMAFALGMDAFSVGLGMGMFRLSLRQIFKIGIIIGMFHIIMPLAGMIAGRFLSEQFGAIAGYLGGLLFILLGVQMIWSSFKEEESTFVEPIGKGLLIFAFGVSLDSFSAGLTLGIYGAKTLLVLTTFGIAAMVMTWLGLLIGRRMQSFLGGYGEALGGSILLAFGIKLLLPI